MGKLGRPLGLQPQVTHVNRTDEFEATFDAALRAGAYAIVVLPEVLFFNNRARLTVNHELLVQATGLIR
jgi:hypothetical protein